MELAWHYDWSRVSEFYLSNHKIVYVYLVLEGVTGYVLLVLILSFSPFSIQDAMIHMRASEPVESAESVESGDEVAQPKDLDIMTQVLGPRSRQYKGYGSMPKLKLVGGSRTASSRGTYQDHEKDKVIATLKEQVTTQAK